MKKITIVTVLVIFTMVASAQQQIPGRIRISFAGFSCEAATPDHVLRAQHDGKGDEVFMFFLAAAVNNEGIITKRHLIQSPVYGDPNGFAGRIGAGSVTDLFGAYKGGIKNGDSYFSLLEALNIDIGISDGLMIIPSIWETDIRPDGAFKPYQVKLENATVSAYPVINKNDEAWTSPYMVTKSFNYPSPITSEQAAYDDSPIGFTKVNNNAVYIDKMIFLTWPVLYNVAGKDLFNKGTGIIPVTFDERITAPGFTSPAAYTMYLKIEIVKAPTTSAPPPAPRNTTTTTPPAVPVLTKTKVDNRTTQATMLKSTFQMTNEFLAGTWKGTMGTGTSQSDSPFSFRFNSGVFWLLNSDGSGSSVAGGSYQLASNNFTASCTDAANTKYTISSVSYNESTAELSGSWTSTGSVYKTGKWIVKKISN